MSMWRPEPPQGVTSEQSLYTIGTVSPRFGTPQGIGVADIPPPVANSWINDEGNSFVTDEALSLVFDV